MRRSKLRGVIVLCIPCTPSARQCERCRTASLWTRGTRGCVHFELACTEPGCCAGCAVRGHRTGGATDLQATAGGGRYCVRPPPGGAAAGPSGQTFETISAACHPSDAALDVTLYLVNLILSGNLPQEAFQQYGLLFGVEKPGDLVRPIAIIEMWYRFAGVCALRTYRRSIGAGLAPPVGVGTPSGSAGGSRHTQRRGDCGARACVGGWQGPWDSGHVSGHREWF